MTCIVGLVDSGRVIIGGDSAGVADLDLTVRADRKVFRNGDAVLGFTSSFRMGQLLAYRLAIPARPEGCDLMKFMVTDFVDAVRPCLRDGGYARLKDGEESAGIFLVGLDRRLFRIEADYQVAEPVHGFDAVGSGQSYALGAMFNPEISRGTALVRRALEAAAEFSAGVRGPFHIQATALRSEETGDARG